MTTDYPLSGEAIPGTLDHKSGDCLIHGPNISVFRPKKALGPFHCVQCALVELSRQYDIEITANVD